MSIKKCSLIEKLNNKYSYLNDNERKKAVEEELKKIANDIKIKGNRFDSVKYSTATKSLFGEFEPNIDVDIKTKDILGDVLSETFNIDLDASNKTGFLIDDYYDVIDNIENNVMKVIDTLGSKLSIKIEDNPKDIAGRVLEYDDNRYEIELKRANKLGVRTNLSTLLHELVHIPISDVFNNHKEIKTFIKDFQKFIRENYDYNILLDRMRKLGKEPTEDDTKEAKDQFEYFFGEYADSEETFVEIIANPTFHYLGKQINPQMMREIEESKRLIKEYLPGEEPMEIIKAMKADRKRLLKYLKNNKKINMFTFMVELFKFIYNKVVSAVALKGSKDLTTAALNAFNLMTEEKIRQLEQTTDIFDSLIYSKLPDNIKAKIEEIDKLINDYTDTAQKEIKINLNYSNKITTFTDKIKHLQYAPIVESIVKTRFLQWLYNEIAIDKTKGDIGRLALLTRKAFYKINKISVDKKNIVKKEVKEKFKDLEPKSRELLSKIIYRTEFFRFLDNDIDIKNAHNNIDKEEKKYREKLFDSLDKNKYFDIISEKYNNDISKNIKDIIVEQADALAKKMVKGGTPYSKYGLQLNAYNILNTLFLSSYEGLSNNKFTNVLEDIDKNKISDMMKSLNEYISILSLKYIDKNEIDEFYKIYKEYKDDIDTLANEHKFIINLSYDKLIKSAISYPAEKSMMQLDNKENVEFKLYPTDIVNRWNTAKKKTLSVRNIMPYGKINGKEFSIVVLDKTAKPYEEGGLKIANFQPKELIHFKDVAEYLIDNLDKKVEKRIKNNKIVNKKTNAKLKKLKLELLKAIKSKNHSKIESLKSKIDSLEQDLLSTNYNIVKKEIIEQEFVDNFSGDNYTKIYKKINIEPIKEEYHFAPIYDANGVLIDIAFDLPFDDKIKNGYSMDLIDVVPETVSFYSSRMQTVFTDMSIVDELFRIYKESNSKQKAEDFIILRPFERYSLEKQVKVDKYGEPIANHKTGDYEYIYKKYRNSLDKYDKIINGKWDILPLFVKRYATSKFEAHGVNGLPIPKAFFEQITGEKLINFNEDSPDWLYGLSKKMNIDERYFDIVQTYLSDFYQKIKGVQVIKGGDITIGNYISNIKVLWELFSLSPLSTIKKMISYTDDLKEYQKLEENKLKLKRSLQYEPKDKHRKIKLKISQIESQQENNRFYELIKDGQFSMIFEDFEEDNENSLLDKRANEVQRIINEKLLNKIKDDDKKDKLLKVLDILYLRKNTKPYQVLFELAQYGDILTRQIAKEELEKKVVNKKKKISQEDEQNIMNALDAMFVNYSYATHKYALFAEKTLGFLYLKYLIRGLQGVYKAFKANPTRATAIESIQSLLGIDLKGPEDTWEGDTLIIDKLMIRNVWEHPLENIDDVLSPHLFNFDTNIVNNIIDKRPDS